MTHIPSLAVVLYYWISSICSRWEIPQHSNSVCSVLTNNDGNDVIFLMAGMAPWRLLRFQKLVTFRLRYSNRAVSQIEGTQIEQPVTVFRLRIIETFMKKYYHDINF